MANNVFFLVLLNVHFSHAICYLYVEFLQGPDCKAITSQSSGGCLPQTKVPKLYIRLNVSAVFQGYNGCLFAYGQTGSGKTFTMQGVNIFLDLVCCDFSVILDPCLTKPSETLVTPGVKQFVDWECFRWRRPARDHPHAV